MRLLGSRAEAAAAGAPAAAEAAPELPVHREPVHAEPEEPAAEPNPPLPTRIFRSSVLSRFDVSTFRLFDPFDLYIYI